MNEFFLLKQGSEREEWVIKLIKSKGSSRELLVEARKLGKKQEQLVFDTWVGLLAPNIKGAQTPNKKTMTIFHADGRKEEKEVDFGVDDTAFKEDLLYDVRDNIPADNPAIDGIIKAYEPEPDPYTRMRIVRALGKIGGTKALTFLRQVLEAERPLRTPAYQEAERHVK